MIELIIEVMAIVMGCTDDDGDDDDGDEGIIIMAVMMIIKLMIEM